MTIASQINRIKANIANTYTALEEKCATLPTVQNSDNLAECVQSITGGSGGSDDSELVSLIDGSITSISNENVTSVGIYAFTDCFELTSADLPNVTSINGHAFYNCSSLTALILRNSTQVCTLVNTNAFDSTPISSGTSFIYVVDDLVNSYKTATNWVTFADQIKSLSEYESEV